MLSFCQIVLFSLILILHFLMFYWYFKFSRLYYYYKPKQSGESDIMDVLLPFFCSILYCMECVSYERKRKSISWMELSFWLHYGCRRSCDRPRKHLEIRISRLVEKVTKIIMPVLFLFLIICGIWAMFVTSNAIDGLKYYLLPDFSKFNFTVFSQAATQVLFSVGIGNIIVSLRFGLLSNIKLPWLDASGISHHAI